jgi:hypothetical protein
VSLRRLVDDGWTASFHSRAMLAPDGIGTAPTPFEAVQVAAWRALNPQRVPTPASAADIEIEAYDTRARPEDSTRVAQRNYPGPSRGWRG